MSKQDGAGEGGQGRDKSQDERDFEELRETLDTSTPDAPSDGTGTGGHPAVLNLNFNEPIEREHGRGTVKFLQQTPPVLKEQEKSIKGKKVLTSKRKRKNGGENCKDKKDWKARQDKDDPGAGPSSRFSGGSFAGSVPKKLRSR